MGPFEKQLQARLDSKRLETDPKCTPTDLIESALKDENSNSNSVSRYLLFLTENSAAIEIIQNFLRNVVGIPAESLSVIFGSSFKNDQDYSEICRNISLIKHSMEVGKTVILLNSYNLYESLYDVLNQYYYEFAGQKYVDLGLGRHRIKASVHDNFRLIVIAEKEAVYDTKRFPIPLINRLEKHFLSAANILNEEQMVLRDELDKWVRTFLKASGGPSKKLKSSQCFIGCHDDTTSSLILRLDEKKASQCEEMETDDQPEIISEAKRILLRCATPDCVIRAYSSPIINKKGMFLKWRKSTFSRL